VLLLFAPMSLCILAAPAQPDEGRWVSLFDGKTLVG